MKLFCSDDDNDGNDSSGDNDHDDSNNGNEDKDNEDNINEDLDHDIQQLGPHEQFLKEHQFPPPSTTSLSVHDDMFNVWHCGSCTYQNLGKAKGACTMYNDPNPI